MKTISNKIQLLILLISLASPAVIAQKTPSDSMKVDTTKLRKVAVKVDSTITKVASSVDTTKMKFDSTKVKVAAKVDTVVKDVKVAVDKAVDKIAPSKPTEVAKIATPANSVTLTADPTSDAVFHKGSLVLGAGIVYQKDLLPIMLVGEYGIGKNIGVEVRTWYGSKITDGVKYNDGLLGVGLNYHFTGNIKSSASKFDTYLGGLFGKILDENGVAFYAQAGARYFFVERVGVFGNFNIGLVGSRGTNLSVGLAYKLY